MKAWHKNLAPAILAMCTLLPPVAPAQSGRKVPQRETPVVRISTIEVELPFNAYDAEGRNVTDLTPKDLIVVENGEPRVITALRRQPASVVLVLDLSSEIGTFKNGASQRYWTGDAGDEQHATDADAPIWAKKHDVVPRPAAREFADNFIRNLNDGDQIAIVQYSDRVQLMQDWTDDREKALDALKSKYRVGLKARYHDALAMAAAKLNERRGRRVMVLLSDGLDSASKSSQRQAMTVIERTGASVFVIGWDEVLKREISGAMSWMGAHEKQSSASYKRIGELKRYLDSLDQAAYDLRELAEHSGGEMLSPADFDQLVAKVPLDLHRELGAQYSLAFVTERGGNLEPQRTVEVIPARPGLGVRARRSYYVAEEGPRS